MSQIKTSSSTHNSILTRTLNRLESEQGNEIVEYGLLVSLLLLFLVMSIGIMSDSMTTAFDRAGQALSSAMGADGEEEGEEGDDDGEEVNEPGLEEPGIGEPGTEPPGQETPVTPVDPNLTPTETPVDTPPGAQPPVAPVDEPEETDPGPDDPNQGVDCDAYSQQVQAYYCATESLCCPT